MRQAKYEALVEKLDDEALSALGDFASSLQDVLMDARDRLRERKEAEATAEAVEAA